MESLLTSVHRAMMNIQLRAEKPQMTLIETFVDSGPLLQLLSKHQ